LYTRPSNNNIDPGATVFMWKIDVGLMYVGFCCKKKYVGFCILFFLTQLRFDSICKKICATFISLNKFIKKLDSKIFPMILILYHKY
jgi:hypothetical protein